jgi:hypothetical protein
MNKFSIASLAVLISFLAAAGERAPAQTLSQLPRVVADEIREHKGNDCAPKGGLAKAIHQRSLSGPGARDYILDQGAFVCGEYRSPGLCGSGGCGLSVFLNPRRGKWVKARELLVFEWRTIRQGGRTLFVTHTDGHGCGPSKSPPCVTTYRASRGRLVQIKRVRGRR